MKTILVFFLLMAALVVTGISQTKEKTDAEQTIKQQDLPKDVLINFVKAYPTAKIKNCSKETEGGKTTYEIESKEGNIARDVSYTADGSLVSVEESMQYKELPEAVQASITKEYPKQKIRRCEKVTKGSITQFEVLLKSGKKRLEIVFDKDGKIVEQEKQ